MKQLNELPLNIQAQVKEVLKAYHNVNVIYANGEYRVSSGYCIMSEYPSDYEVIGDYNDEEVFTLLERIANYKESFKYDDYALIREAKEKGLMWY